ncbi:phosphoribosylformylglycinamidine synthase I [Candidatus Poribacteria bacterium]|jgi:phosphoribosylformylglycinamidine synthase subunit PurQ / glutaminase|nr:phosphoribosylformylglycinamidine synthase I [Candidatus Poribacteria bacterium]MBT5532172.1 phosphoribosylformylglycinamidine synthase I [Candidatus Poribacteria bacterium]MBT7101007.1 phosphoribosylformylglycinamidine synthase I [Candidatus Poribacteria bacterium]MBT7806313.1 phosphoribosylformylglycinamidine synthase I [Candidatus Poribacteria bacterium]
MSATRVLILRTAGTNCDLETEHAFSLAGAAVDRVHVRRMFEDPDAMRAYDILALPGGFSYGDDIAAGRLWANEFVHRLRPAMEEFVSCGKPVIGICNGFQALVRAGLLPGDDGLGAQTATLAWNDSGLYECRWTRLRVEPGPCVFTGGTGDVIELPVAHAEGKFAAPDDLYDGLEAAGRVALRYVTADGGEAAYPANPNGSRGGVAGVCNASGTVLGLMPHPERFVTRTQHPRWTRPGAPSVGHGLAIFENAVRYAAERTR